MDKQEFINYMAESLECSPKAAEIAIEMFTEGVSLAMSEGHNVNIDNLGKFAISNIPSRKVRVPGTNKLVTARQYRKPYFTPAKDLKICCNF